MPVLASAWTYARASVNHGYCRVPCLPTGYSTTAGLWHLVSRSSSRNKPQRPRLLTPKHRVLERMEENPQRTAERSSTVPRYPSLCHGITTKPSPPKCNATIYRCGSSTGSPPVPWLGNNRTRSGRKARITGFIGNSWWWVFPFFQLDASHCSAPLHSRHRYMRSQNLLVSHVMLSLVIFTRIPSNRALTISL